MKMNCKICGGSTESRFSTKILKKYQAEFLHCRNCGYLFAADPYWLDEAYKNAINLSDTGIMSRNLHFSRVVSVIIYFIFNKNTKYLDYAGGYGIFTRLMRDNGFDFYWYDPYCENLLSRGFEYKAEVHKDIELLTSFEVFEHFINPIGEIEKMLTISRNICFSTVTLPDSIPEPDKWWYYGLDHGQHISFYSNKTLSFIAQRNGLQYYNYKDFHLFTDSYINPNLFKFLILSSRTGLYLYVKKKLKSRTWDDYLFLTQMNK